MSMNYVGSVTVVDRGDAPAQAVMDRNARSLAQRVADETRHELEKVMTRVENIYGSFEMSSEFENLEYVNDIGELEELIRDQVKKRKYQQQVTIFVVGFTDVCGQRLRLLQQVNEFFTENSKSYEEEDWFPRTPDIDLDDVQDKIEESLTTANELSTRLGELNKEIVECLAAYAEKKATNRGKKKMEKALQAAKDEVGNLSEKLLGIQGELEEKDEKMQALFKQLEVKNLELQRYKTAAEVAKKNVQDSERLQAQIVDRDEKLAELRQHISHLEVEVTSSQHYQEMSQSKLMSASEENQHRITQLTKEVEEGRVAVEDARRDLVRNHESQLTSLKEGHEAELTELKTQHANEIHQLTEELEKTKQDLIAAQHRAAQLQSDKGDRSDTASDVVKHFDLDPSEPPSQATTRVSTREGSRQESRSNKSSRQGSVASKKSGKSPSRQESKPGSRASQKREDDNDELNDEDVVDISCFTPEEAKEYAEAAVQDEGGSPSASSVEKSKAPSRASRLGLPPVQETDADLENAFDLLDDAAWTSVPKDEIAGRFGQYRKLCKRRVSQLEEQLQLTQAKTQRKVLTLKSQFQEHKGKWEAERKLLIEQVSQAHRLQSEAEKEADAAMTQLEDFINEQEKLEHEEEVKRTVILRRTDAVVRETKIARQQEETTEGATAVDQRDGREPEQDMNRLMRQTDDAKKSKTSSPASESTRSDPLSFDAILQVRNSSGEAVSQPTEGSALGKLDMSGISSRQTRNTGADTDRSGRSTDRSGRSTDRSGRITDRSDRRTDRSGRHTDRSDGRTGQVSDKSNRMAFSSATENSVIELKQRDVHVLSQKYKSCGVITKLLTPSYAVIQVLIPDSYLGDKREDGLEFVEVNIDTLGHKIENKLEINEKSEEDFTNLKVFNETYLIEGDNTILNMDLKVSGDPSIVEADSRILEEITQLSEEAMFSEGGKTNFLDVPERKESLADGVSEMTADEGYSTVPDGIGDTGADYQQDLDLDDLGLGKGEATEIDEGEATEIGEGEATEIEEGEATEIGEGEATERKREEITMLDPDAICIDFPESDREVQELNARMTTTGAMSAPPAAECEEETEEKPKCVGLETVVPRGIHKQLTTVEEVLDASMSEQDVDTGKSLNSRPLMSSSPIPDVMMDDILSQKEDLEKRLFPSSSQFSNSMLFSKIPSFSIHKTLSGRPVASVGVFVTPVTQLGLDNDVEHISPSTGKKSGMVVDVTQQFDSRVGDIIKNENQIMLVDGVPHIMLKEKPTFESKSGKACEYPLKNAIESNQPESDDSILSAMEAKRDISFEQSIYDSTLTDSQHLTVTNLKRLMKWSTSRHEKPKLLLQSVRNVLSKDLDLTDEQKLHMNTLVALASLLVLEEAAIGLHAGDVLGNLANISPDDWEKLSAGVAEEITGEEVELTTPETTIEQDSTTRPQPQSTGRETTSLAPQKSFASSAGSRHSDRSERSSRSKASGADAQDVQIAQEVPKSGSLSRGSQTPSEKRSLLTPSDNIIRETSSMSATSGLLSVPQTPGKMDSAEEEIRASSARSRASLRNQFRQKLEETKKVVDERRTKSPGITIPTPRSLDEDELNEEEEDVPLPDDLKEGYRSRTLDMATSPPPGMKREDTLVSIHDAKHTPSLADHPVVQDFVKVYEGVVTFKDTMSRILMEKDLMSASQILSDLDTLQLDSSAKIQPQINNMTYNIYFMLEEIAELLSSVLVMDKEPNVSSLMAVSRDMTKATLQRDPTDASSVQPLATRGSQISDGSDMKTSSTVRELQEQYERLNEHFEVETRKHEEQLKHNTVVMMEMQDTINDLQRELSTLGKTAKRSRSATPNLTQRSQQLGSPEASVMFTRLDSERNAKIMKKAVMDDRLGTDRYKEAVSQMREYVSLPAQRLAHLVRKYTHHCRMKAIEENVKGSDSLDEDVFDVLDKMEALQNERARKWGEHMDDLGSERLRLANSLMETLDSIEQESGLFLIKPMYSYRGRDMKGKYSGKLSRPVRPRRLSPRREAGSSMAPAPTPSSHLRPVRDDRHYPKVSSATGRPQPRPDPLRPLEGDNSGLSGASMGWVGQSPRQTWSFSSSHAKNVPADPLNLYNTPRILELDINRMLIGQNNISSLMSQQLVDDRLASASQSNLRSYVTVNRPVATPTNTTSSSRPRSTSGTPRDSVPPTTPQQTSSAGKKKVRVSDTDVEMSMTLRNTPPLPPISAAEPPHSPAGSTPRHTPTARDTPTTRDMTTDTKHMTRESSQMTSTSASDDE